MVTERLTPDLLGGSEDPADLDATPKRQTAPELGVDAKAYQAYVLALKLYWTRVLYKRVVAEGTRLLQNGPLTPKELDLQMRGLPPYRLFASLERLVQQLKYYGRWGIVPEVQAQAPELVRYLNQERLSNPERLRLEADLPLPDYYTQADFHQHRGGIWSDDYDAFVYELAATTTTPTFDNHADLHTQFADYVRTLCTPAFVCDMGCGFGKTTLPLKVAMPDATVIGCDLSANVLSLAHARAEEQGLDITFVQDNHENMKTFSDDSVDLITGTMLIHELPLSALRNSLRQAHRVLQPGGLAVYLDFVRVPGGPLGQFLIRGHAARNREPYLQGMLDTDLVAEVHLAGFPEVSIEPFGDAKSVSAGRDAVPEAWEFPWSVLIARKEV